MRVKFLTFRSRDKRDQIGSRDAAIVIEQRLTFDRQTSYIRPLFDKEIDPTCS